MYLKLSIECSCLCRYSVDQDIAIDIIACPNCGKSPESSKDIVKMLKIANQIPEREKQSDGHEIIIKTMSFTEDMPGF